MCIRDRNVHVVDGSSAAIGSGILAEYALRLVDMGKSAAEIASILEEKKKDVCLIAMLLSLIHIFPAIKPIDATAIRTGKVRLMAAKGVVPTKFETKNPSTML